jgi:hypothetical protein
VVGVDDDEGRDKGLGGEAVDQLVGGVDDAVELVGAVADVVEVSEGEVADEWFVGGVDLNEVGAHLFDLVVGGEVGVVGA